MAQSYELKPCPCCGGEANLRFYGDPHCTVIAIVCDECRLGTRVVALDDYLSAVNAWNARAERTCHVDTPEGWYVGEGYCSNCHAYLDGTENYCWECGAKVVE